MLGPCQLGTFIADLVLLLPCVILWRQMQRPQIIGYFEFYYIINLIHGWNDNKYFKKDTIWGYITMGGVLFPL